MTRLPASRAKDGLPASAAGYAALTSRNPGDVGLGCNSRAPASPPPDAYDYLTTFGGPFCVVTGSPHCYTLSILPRRLGYDGRADAAERRARRPFPVHQPG